jgi:hypothetical protein
MPENHTLMRSPLIVVATPCYGGLVTQGYMESVLQLSGYAAANRFEVTLAMNGGDSLITRSRNKLVSVFMDIAQATHLLFIDADIAFRPESVLRMLGFNQPIVAGMYPIKGIDWQRLERNMPEDRTADQLRESALHYVGEPCTGADREERDGFVTAAYAGTGFKLIQRGVIERMIDAYPETRYRVAQTYPAPTTVSPHQYALFDCMIDPATGIYLSEDYAFCQRWRKLGGKIWLDSESRLTHVGSYKFSGRPRG